MAIEIVDFPINSMVIFHSYVTVYQRVSIVTRDVVKSMWPRILLQPVSEQSTWRQSS